MDEQQSRQAFKEVKNWDELLKLWSRFYSNEIYVPGYCAKFIDEEGDNPQANNELGKLFQDITGMEVICTNSQVSIKAEQKAYFTGYSFSHILYPLFIELNRLDGISAIMLDLSNMKKTESFSNFPFVTYSDWNQDAKKRGPKFGQRYGHTGRMYGNSSSHLGIDFGTASDVDFITKWLNKDMQKVVSKNTMCQIIVWDANTSSPEFHLFEVIKSALKYVHMQNKLFKAFGEEDVELVTKLVKDMKEQDVLPDVQQHGYGLQYTSMLEAVVINFLISKGKKFKVVLNLLLNEIDVIDVNIYNDFKSLYKKFPKKRVDQIFELLDSKLPEWFNDRV